MKHNQNMIAAIYHQSAVWINFYDHSWLFHQSLKYRSMLRVSWTEHKTNEEVLKMANTTRSLLTMIKKRKCQYFERGRSGQTSGPVASVKDWTHTSVLMIMYTRSHRLSCPCYVRLVGWGTCLLNLSCQLLWILLFLVNFFTVPLSAGQAPLSKIYRSYN